MNIFRLQFVLSYNWERAAPNLEYRLTTKWSDGPRIKRKERVGARVAVVQAPRWRRLHAVLCSAAEVCSMRAVTNPTLARAPWLRGRVPPANPAVPGVGPLQPVLQVEPGCSPSRHGGVSFLGGVEGVWVWVGV